MVTVFCVETRSRSTRKQPSTARCSLPRNAKIITWDLGASQGHLSFILPQLELMVSQKLFKAPLLLASCVVLIISQKL